jgi:hypothetical protein
MLTGAGCRIEALRSRERATGQRQLCSAPHAPHQRVRLSGHPRRLSVFHGSRLYRSAPPKCKDRDPRGNGCNDLCQERDAAIISP